MKKETEEQIDDNQPMAKAEVSETTPEHIEERENLIDELAAQLAAEKDKNLRLYAEFENFRRRTAKERIELVGSASEDVLKSLLPIVDDFERAIEANKSVGDAALLKEGFELLLQKLSKTLQARGLKQIPAKGLPFDAEQHEAIAQLPVSDDAQKGIVIDVAENGYTLNEKVIRHPKVVVGC